MNQAHVEGSREVAAKHGDVVHSLAKSGAEQALLATKVAAVYLGTFVKTLVVGSKK
jgi:hypothetical protein